MSYDAPAQAAAAEIKELRKELDRLTGQLSSMLKSAYEQGYKDAQVCGCIETYPQLVAGKVSHGPGCPAAALAIRRYYFDRIRYGKVMAEGISVQAENIEDARRLALRLAGNDTDEIRLRADASSGDKSA